MTSAKQFAQSLLAAKRVAIAPGTAFDTSYEAPTCYHDNHLGLAAGNYATHIHMHVFSYIS